MDKAGIVATARQSMTYAQKTIWGFLKGNRLNRLHFQRQQIIKGYMVDFYCQATELIIEIDDPDHAWKRDQEPKRERVLKTCGSRILRFSADRVRYDLFNVLEEIVSAVPLPLPGWREEGES